MRGATSSTVRHRVHWRWFLQGAPRAAGGLGQHWLRRRGKPIRRRVTGPTKTAVLEAVDEPGEELGRAPRSSR